MVPTYCYKTEQGRMAELFWPIGKAPKTMTIDGKVAHRDYRAEHPIQHHADLYPKTSSSCGVSKSQIKQAEAHSRKVGVPTHYNERGDPMFTSRTHQNDFLKATGRRNNDPGWGDYAGR